MIAHNIIATFCRALRIGPGWLHLGTAVFAVATTALGATVAIEAQLAVLLAGLVAMLAAEQAAERTGDAADHTSAGG